MTAVITVKIHPIENPLFCCATQWFKLFVQLAQNIPFEKDLHKEVIMLFPALTGLISKMHGQNHPASL